MAVLVIGTDGFGQDTEILGRPGHRRRLKALSRLHGGSIWVKPDLLDLGSKVPEAVRDGWPEVEAALKAYDHVVYAATPVRGPGDAEAVADLLDLFFVEHGTRLVGKARKRWEDETLRLVPGHAYFLDPRPDLDPAGRNDRVARRLRYGLLPLLRDYLAERLCGGATEAVAGLADRIEAAVLPEL